MRRLLKGILGLVTDVDRVFFHPDAKDRGTPADAALEFEDVCFAAADGTQLHGWFLPAERSPRGTILHLHGNAANISGHYAFIKALPRRGYNVLTFDYRGYGRSAGQPSRDGLIDDAEAALDYLRSREDVDGSSLFLLGQSIGGAVGCALAARRRGCFGAIVIDSAFSGYRAIVRHHVLHNPLLFLLGWWFPFLIPRRHEPLDCVSELSPTPTLFMHGTADRIVPPSMSRALFDAAREPKQLWLIPGMDHTEVWWESEAETADRVAAFFAAPIDNE